MEKIDKQYLCDILFDKFCYEQACYCCCMNLNGQCKMLHVDTYDLYEECFGNKIEKVGE